MPVLAALLLLVVALVGYVLLACDGEDPVNETWREGE